MGWKCRLAVMLAMAWFVILGPGAMLARADDVEFIMGTSSGFKVVRGTSVSSGTTTVRIATNVYATGTITAAGGFVGDGSQLTNLPAGSVANDSVSSASIINGTIVNEDVSSSAAIATSKLSGAVTSITSHGLGALATLNTVSTSEITDGTIAGGDLASNISISTTGTMSVAGGNFKVDANGSMTATTITATGSVTASGGLTVKNGASSGYVELYEPSGSGTNKITIQSQGISADYTLTLPVDDGTNGQSLTTDGSGGLSWTSVGGGSSVYGFVQLTSTTGTGFSSETNFGAGETESTATSGTTWDAVNSKLTIDAGNGGTYKVLVNLVLIGSDNADTYNLALKVEGTTKNSVTGFSGIWNNYPFPWSITWVGTINAS